MFQRLRKHLTPSTFIAFIALAFAMTGGAYAASRYVITSTKQISPKVLKSLQGKSGVSGAAGAQGSAGAAGPQGPSGPAGPAGVQGEAGAPGANGASVTSKTVSKNSTTCSKLGGSEFTVTGGKTTTACNGKEGSPWTAGGTLPGGATETGTLGFYLPPTAITTAGGGGYAVPISFTIPLAVKLEASHVHYVNHEGLEVTELSEYTPGYFVEVTAPSTECTGSAESPTAPPGNLCVYAGAEENIVSASPRILSFSTAGAYEFFSPESAAEGYIVRGSWAVTG
jgi:hypothetical protein